MTNSDYIALMAAVVSCCAMLGTFWQGFIASKHSKLSVRPHLDYELIARDGEPFRLTIVNHGLGPAIVDRFSILIDDDEVVISDVVDWGELARKVNHLPDELAWSAITIGAPIPSGGQVDVVSFNPVLDITSDRKDAMAILQQIGLLVSYRSIYKENFSLFKPSRKAQ